MSEEELQLTDNGDGTFNLKAGKAHLIEATKDDIEYCLSSRRQFNCFKKIIGRLYWRKTNDR